MESHVVKELTGLKQTAKHRREHWQVGHDSCGDNGVGVCGSSACLQAASCRWLQSKYPHQMLIHNVSLNCYHFVCNIQKFYVAATAAIKYGICISGTILLLIAFTRTFQSNNGCHQGCCYCLFFVNDSQLVFAFVAATFLKGFVNKI